MGLGLNNGGGNSGGEFLPLLSYNAKAGRLKAITRIEEDGAWVKHEADLTFEKPVFVMDLANVMVGWQLFRAGQAPDVRMVKLGQPLPPKPGEDFGEDKDGKKVAHKQGFTVRVLDANRVLREFGGNSGSVLTAVDTLHSAYSAAQESGQGLLPVVQFTGAVESKTKYGSNYVPTFAIVKWVPRPSEMGAAPVASAPADPASAPTPSGHMPPPPPAAAAPTQAMPF